MTVRGDTVVLQEGEGESYWQPGPANGFVELKVHRKEGGAGALFESGIQSVAPGGFVREHAHDQHEELICVYQGEGKAYVDADEYDMRPGTVLYLGPNRKHRFVNTSQEDLRFFWTLLPGGLGEFMSAIASNRHVRLLLTHDEILSMSGGSVFARARPNATRLLDRLPVSSFGNP